MVELNISSYSQEKSCYYIFDEENDLGDLNRVGLLSLLIFSFLFITLSNILLIHGMRRTNKNMSLTNKLFIYLSSCDLVTGLVTVPLQTSMLVLGTNSSCLLVGIQAFFNAFTPLLTMFTLLTMSTLRYISIKKPLRRIKEIHVYTLLLLQQLTALGITVWYVAISQSPITTYGLGVFLALVTSLCFCLIGSSVAVSLFLHFSLSKNKVVRIHSTFTKKKKKKATNTLLILSVVLIFCYFPNGVAFAIISYNVLGDDPSDTSYRDYVPWAHIPMVMNAGINSFVYIARNRRIRTFYYDLLFRNQMKNSITA